LSVKKYSLKSDGNKNIAENFKICEFACKDGSDEILISEELVDTLQNIRNHFGKAVVITSAYRTKSHNKKAGGASSSQHLKGAAADIQVSGVDPLAVAFYAQSLNVGGIGLYSYINGGFVHIDVRTSHSRWIQVEKTGNYSVVNSIMPKVKCGAKSKAVTVLQRKLKALGFDCGTADGICGTKTVKSIKEFQRNNQLSVDGICGKNTWAKLGSEVLRIV